MWDAININRAEIQLFKVYINIYIFIFIYILYELFMLSVEKCRQRIEKCLYNCELRIVVAAFGQSLAINQAAQYDRRRLVSESQSPSPSSDLPGDCD